MERSELKGTLTKMVDQFIDPNNPQETIDSFVERVVAIVDVYAGTHEQYVEIRGTLGNVTRNMGDSKKEITAQLTCYNTPKNLMAFARIGAGVTIRGLQADIEARIEGSARASEGEGNGAIVQTDLEEHCDELTKKRAELENKLAAILPTPEQIADFIERSSWEEWWVDVDVAQSVDEAKLQGAYAFEKGAAHGANPYDSHSQCKLYEAWSLAHYEVESVRKSLEEIGQPEFWPGDEIEPSTVPVMSPWASKTKAELKAELDRRGVECPRHPTKPELIEALEKAIAEAGPSEDEPSGEEDSAGADDGAEEDAEKEAAVA